MKTLLLTLVISGIMVSNISATKFPVSFRLNDESYIPDIPFNTEEIAKCSQDTIKTNNALPQMKDEEYVDDIPFDTSEIAKISR